MCPRLKPEAPSPATCGGCTHPMSPPPSPHGVSAQRNHTCLEASCGAPDCPAFDNLTCPSTVSPVAAAAGPSCQWSRWCWLWRLPRPWGHTPWLMGSGCTAVSHLLPSLHTSLTLWGAAHSSLGSHSLVTAVSPKGRVLPQDEGKRRDMCISKPFVCDVPPGHSWPCTGQPFSSTAALRSRGLDLLTACIRIPWGASKSPPAHGRGWESVRECHQASVM